MTPTRLAGIGAFVIGGILLFAIGLFLIGERRMLFQKKFTLYTEFGRISGLQPGAPVKVNGMGAGEVEEIAVPASPAGKFRVRLKVREDLHPLVRTDSVASIQTEGLVGGTFLFVNAGSDAAPRVANDGTIPGREPFEMADLMVQMSDTIRTVNETITALRGDVESAVSDVADTAKKANVLLTEVSDDVAAISESGRRIMGDAQAIMTGLQQGHGTVGRLLKDDEVYERVTATAREAQAVVEEARKAVQQGRRALESLQSEDGPTQGMAADLRETLAHARATLANMEENTEALKRNFLFRGFFKDRGYYDLRTLSPAEYRAGALEGDKRRALRIWLRSTVLFVTKPDGTEELTREGQGRVDSAMAGFLQYVHDAPLVIEGYSTVGGKTPEYMQARARAQTVRDYVLTRFDLAANHTAAMPLGENAAGSPDGGSWDGIALAVFVERRVLQSGATQAGGSDVAVPVNSAGPSGASGSPSSRLQPPR
jgi:phospholipid/cholesterol/gamma-HCH transport system substrate-binding protein